MCYKFGPGRSSCDSIELRNSKGPQTAVSERHFKVSALHTNDDEESSSNLGVVQRSRSRSVGEWISTFNTRRVSTRRKNVRSCTQGIIDAFFVQFTLVTLCTTVHTLVGWYECIRQQLQRCNRSNRPRLSGYNFTNIAWYTALCEAFGPF